MACFIFYIVKIHIFKVCVCLVMIRKGKEERCHVGCDGHVWLTVAPLEKKVFFVWQGSSPKAIKRQAVWRPSHVFLYNAFYTNCSKSVHVRWHSCYQRHIEIVIPIADKIMSKGLGAARV